LLGQNLAVDLVELGLEQSEILVVNWYLFFAEIELYIQNRPKKP